MIAIGILMTSLLTAAAQETSPATSDRVLAGLVGMTVARMKPSRGTGPVDIEMLYAMVERRLRERGVPGPGDAAPTAELSLLVGVFGKESAYTCELSLEIWEEVELRRSPGVLLTLPTWRAAAIDTSGTPLEERLSKATLWLVDQFIDAWNRAHPKSGP